MASNAREALPVDDFSPDNTIPLLRFFHGKKQVLSRLIDPKSPERWIKLDDTHFRVQTSDDSDPAADLKFSIKLIKSLIVRLGPINHILRC